MNKVTTVWPLSVRLAHWLNAALVIGALVLGAFMVLAVHSAATRFELTQTHKSIGVGVLVLTILRLCLRSVMRAPKPEPASRSVTIVAKAAHVTLYVLLLLLPLSGWLMVTSTPVRVPTIVFGLFELPYPLAPDIARFRLAMPRNCFRGHACRACRSPCGGGARSRLGLARPHTQVHVAAG